MRDVPSFLDTCTFESCVWHIDIVVTDKIVWEAFLATQAPMIGNSLPLLPEVPGEADQKLRSTLPNEPSALLVPKPTSEKSGDLPADSGAGASAGQPAG
jgi:hypothetical protein